MLFTTQRKGFITVQYCSTISLSVVMYPGQQMRIPSVLTDQARSSQIRSDQVRSGQIQSDLVRSSQIRSDPVRSGQIRPDPVRSGQIKSDPVRSGQIGSDRVRSSQIRFFFVLIQIQNFWARTQIEMIHFNKSKIYSPKSI